MPPKKKPVTPKPFDLVVVHWEDACTMSSMQVTNPAEALALYTPTMRRSTGYFCGRTKAVVVIATDDDRVGTSPHALGGISYIPTSLVREITVVAPTTVRFK